MQGKSLSSRNNAFGQRLDSYGASANTARDIGLHDLDFLSPDNDDQTDGNNECQTNYHPAKTIHLDLRKLSEAEKGAPSGNSNNDETSMERKRYLEFI